MAYQLEWHLKIKYLNPLLHIKGNTIMIRIILKGALVLDTIEWSTINSETMDMILLF
jgi:hypothetical protein